MKKATSAVKASLPLVVLTFGYIAIFLSEVIFGFPGWLSWIFVLVLGTSLLLSLNIKLSSLRKSTEREILGIEQISDEPIPLESSGTLLLSDLSTLRAWRSSSEFMLEPINRKLVDVKLSGPNSWEVARKMGLSTPYIYDVPETVAGDFLDTFNKESLRYSTKVKASAESYRVHHQVRARRAAEKGAALFNILDRELLCIPFESAKLVRSWLVDGTLENLDIYTSEEPVSFFQIVGSLHFHSNALTVADAKALDEWDSFETRDGLFDLIVMGDGALSASLAGGRQVRPSVWVFNDLELARAESIGRDFLREDPQAQWALNPHSDEFFMTSQLAIDPLAERVLPSGSVHAMRLEADEAIVAAGFSSAGDLVKVRLSFTANPENIFLLPPPKKFEILVASMLKRFRRSHAKRNASASPVDLP